MLKSVNRGFIQKLNPVHVSLQRGPIRRKKRLGIGKRFVFDIVAACSLTKLLERGERLGLGRAAQFR